MKNYFVQNVPNSHRSHLIFAKSVNSELITPIPNHIPIIFIPIFTFLRLPYLYFKYPSGNFLCEGMSGVYFSSVLKLVRPKINIIYHDADLLFLRNYNHLNGLKKVILNLFLGKIDYVISDSVLSAKSIKKYLKINSEVVYPPVEVNNFKFKPNLNSKQIIHVGRISSEKNLERLIKAFVKVKMKIPESRLVFIGPGNSDNLKSLASDLGVKIEFKGFVKNLNSELNNSLIGYNVSNFEPFGCNGLEYSLSGVIPITGRKNGNNEVLTESKIICNEKSVVDISNKIIELMSLSNTDKLNLLKSLKSKSEKINDKSQSVKFKNAFGKLKK